ncbi:MAG: tRNA (guanosine(46)-N7)-methyltransferase TrmB [Alphaproteobacteria bacterium]
MNFTNPQFPNFYGRRSNRGLSAMIKQRIAADHSGLILSADRIKQENTGNFDPKSLFGHNPQAIWLEIGFGSGELLTHLASNHPNDGFIGAEAYYNGFARALRDSQNGNLSNIRLYSDDVRPLIAKLKPNSLDRLLIMFPDPWPKRRHRTRRMIGPLMIPEFSRILKSGGMLIFASDHPHYVNWALHHLLKDNDFIWQVKSPDDWLIPPVNFKQTRYQQKQLAGIPSFFQFKKK